MKTTTITSILLHRCQLPIMNLIAYKHIQHIAMAKSSLTQEPPRGLRGPPERPLLQRAGPRLERPPPRPRPPGVPRGGRAAGGERGGGRGEEAGRRKEQGAAQRDGRARENGKEKNVSALRKIFSDEKWYLRAYTASLCVKFPTVEENGFAMFMLTNLFFL